MINEYTRTSYIDTYRVTIIRLNTPQTTTLHIHLISIYLTHTHTHTYTKHERPFDALVVSSLYSSVRGLSPSWPARSLACSGSRARGAAAQSLRAGRSIRTWARPSAARAAAAAAVAVATLAAEAEAEVYS